MLPIESNIDRGISMVKLILVLTFVFCVGLVGVASAQDAAQKTKDLVAALDKTKYKKKDKGTVLIEFFADVKNEPVVKANVTEYSGAYGADGYLLTLSVAPDGAVKGSGYDSSINGDKAVNFTLKNTRVDGALITGTKEYDNGTEQPFEAVFVNRTSRSGANPKSVDTESTQFGIGFIQYGGASISQCDPDKATKPEDKNATVADLANKNSGWINRVFLARR